MSEFVLWRMDDNGNRGEMYWVTICEPRDSDLMTEEVDRHERKK